MYLHVVSIPTIFILKKKCKLQVGFDKNLELLTHHSWFYLRERFYSRCTNPNNTIIGYPISTLQLSTHKLVKHLEKFCIEFHPCNLLLKNPNNSAIQFQSCNLLFTNPNTCVQSNFSLANLLYTNPNNSASNFTLATSSSQILTLVHPISAWQPPLHKTLTILHSAFNVLLKSQSTRQRGVLAHHLCCSCM